MEFIVIAIILIIGIILYMVKEAFRNKVVLNVIEFSDFPETFGEVSIFFISDIHRRKIPRKLISKINEKIDLVIIGGDLTEKGVPFTRIEHNLNLLKELGPVYFVWGNNDYEMEYHELDGLLIKKGVKILDNTAVTFESAEGEKLIVLGIDDMNKKRDRLDWALEDAGEEGFRILVSHDPRITTKITPEQNIRLVLAGHTHGGQIHILGYSPYEKGGIKILEHTILLTSNGYGTTAIPLRLGASAETHLIKLKRK
ncbi:metallophosphoesterase [Pseudoneobacillus sp. C159]